MILKLFFIRLREEPAIECPLYLIVYVKFKNLVAPSQQKFCKRTESPADVASRDCAASELVKNDIWSKGPAWMNSLTIFLPEIKTELDDEEVFKEQCKTVVCLLILENAEFELLPKFSSWTKLKCVTA